MNKILKSKNKGTGSIGFNNKEEKLKQVYEALAKIGENNDLRTKLITFCLKIEKLIQYPEGSIRDDITGPIVDVLHEKAGVLSKKLSCDTVIYFKYKSKITRDFVMSTPENPNHVWEPQTTKLLIYLAANKKNVIIGGAYFGDQAILVAKKLVAFNGYCHAFEANADSISMLKRNTKINNLNNMIINQIGLWNEDNGTLKLVGDDAYAFTEVTSGKKNATIENESIIETITIDTYLKEKNIDKVELIMIDIEGGELKALQGGKSQLALSAGEAPNIMFEIHRSYTDWSNGLENTDIVKYLKSFGYNIFAIRDFQSNYDMGNKPIEIIPPERTYLEGPPHGFNMLAVKDLSIIQNDNFKICYDVSPKLLIHKDPKLHHPTDGL